MFYKGDTLKYNFLHKIFYIAVVLCIYSFSQMYATPLFKVEECEAGQGTFRGLKTAGISRNNDEFVNFNFSDDTIWFSVMAATSPPVLEVDVTELDFGETDTSKTFSITNSGDETLVWSLLEDEEWLTVDATSGSIEKTKSTTVTVEVDRSKVLTVGEVNGNITINSNGGNAEIEVTMTVPEQPVLEVSPSSLDFDSEYVVKELFITNSGTGVLDWAIAAQEEWISIDHESGTVDEGKTEVITVMVDRSAVTELGSYSDELSITSDGGDATVSVEMERVNHSPEIPTVVSPADGASEQSLYTTLSWQGGDIDTEDGDVLSYDVYFSANESLVDAEDVSVLTCADMGIGYCDPGTNSLEGTTNYYWKVIAKDSYGEITPGSVWSFTTEDDNTIILCPAFALELGYEERNFLRRLRDEVLTKDEDGKHYINLYYRYSWELLIILFIDDELRVEAMEIFEGLLPSIKTLLIDDKVFVTVEMLEEIRELLGKVALHASPPLKTVLKRLQADIKNIRKMEAFGILVSD